MLKEASRAKALSGPPRPAAMNGGEAVAEAMRQIEPEVVAAYPITPQTLIIERFSEFIADGLVRSEFITVESEHAALSACVGASAAGARAETATGGPGLALMFEILGVASGMRLPIVMHLCTRALSSPINILCDHSDAMAMRDSSWVMMAGATPQEAYDQAVIAHTIAEHPQVMLPFANMVDGFTVTHAVERVDLLADEDVRQFVGEYEPRHYALDPDCRITFGGLDFRDFYFEHRRQQQEGMEQALDVTREALWRFQQISGRRYHLVEPYRLEDADVAMVVIGSTDGVVRDAVDAERRVGIRAGALRVRLFRPFPSVEVASMLGGVKAVGVMDRAISPGAPVHPLMSDVAMSLRQSRCQPMLKSFVYGLGGRVITRGMVRRGFQELVDRLDNGRPDDVFVTHMGLADDRRGGQRL